MSIPVGLLSETFVAEQASVWSRFKVGPEMLQQRSMLLEGLAAQDAAENHVLAPRVLVVHLRRHVEQRVVYDLLPTQEELVLLPLYLSCAGQFPDVNFHIGDPSLSQCF